MSKKILGVLVLVFFTVGFSCMGSQPPGAEKAHAANGAVTLTILHTNDTHSELFSFGPNDTTGGIARMSTLIKQRKALSENTLVLNAGDVFVGTFAFNKYLGYAELKIMEGLYDAMCLGNHEFDLGLAPLAGVLSGVLGADGPVTMPVLCANVDIAAAGLSGLVSPYTIKDVGGIKVGIFGVVNTDPQNYSTEVLAALTDPIDAATIQADYLKNEAECGIVICLSHLGLGADVVGIPPLVPALADVDNIDIIIGGHSHDAMEPQMEVNGKIIVQAGEFGKYLGELKVSLNGTGVNFESYTLHSINSKIRKDPELLNTLNQIRAGIVQDPRFGPVYTEHVAKAMWDMEDTWEDGNPWRDTAVGNLVTDAIKTGLENAEYGVDIAMEAMGYTSSKFFKGKVVGNDVMRVVPYGYDPVSGLGFKITLVQLVGAQILGGLEYSLNAVEYIDDISMQVSGMTYEYDSFQTAGNRLDPASVKVNGTAIYPNNLDTPYWVALNENVAAFLIKMLTDAGNPPLAINPTNLFEYNLVRDFMKGLNHVGYSAEGRVIDHNFDTP